MRRAPATALVIAAVWLGVHLRRRAVLNDAVARIARVIAVSRLPLVDARALDAQLAQIRDLPEAAR